jgi:hypothetical protein
MRRGRDDDPLNQTNRINLHRLGADDTRAVLGFSYMGVGEGMRTGEMKNLCTFKITIEKCDSTLVPYDIIHLDVESEEHECELRDDISLVTTEHISLPEFDFKLEVGDRLEFEAELFGEFYTVWTDCGYEHDADFEFRNAKELRVWRCVHEKANA